MNALKRLWARLAQTPPGDERYALAESLCDTAAALNSTLDLDQVLDRILANVGRVVPHDAANVMLVKDGLAYVLRGRGYAERGLSDRVTAMRLAVAETPKLLKMIRTGKPVVISDTHRDPDWVRRPESEWVRSLLGVPIKAQGEVIGLINLDSATPRFFTPAHAQHLRAFADQASLAIQNARLYERVQRRQRYLETLRRVSSRAAPQRDRDALLQAVVDGLVEEFGYTCATIMLLDEDGKNLTALAEAGRTLGSAEQPYRIPISKGAMGWVVRHDAPRLVADTARDPFYLRPPGADDIASELVVPLRQAGRVVGVLNVESVEKNAFDSLDVEVLMELADELAVRMQNADLHRAARLHAAELEQRVAERTADLQATNQLLLAQIAEREQAEAALEASQARLAAFARALPDLGFILDAEGRYVEVLAQQQELLAAGANRLKGRTLRNVLPGETADRMLATVRRTLETGQPQSLEYALDVAAGARVFEARTAPMPGQAGRLPEVVWIARDITARKEAEEALRESERRYRHLFDYSLNGFALHEIVTDAEDRPIDYIFLEVNRAFEEQTGLKAEEVIGRRATEVLPGLENDPFIEIFGRVALTGQPARFEQYSSPLDRTYLISAFSPRWRQFATLFTDITERIQAEEAERQQRALAEALRDTAAALNSTLDLDGVLDSLLTNVQRVLPHDIGNVMLVEKGVASVVRERGYTERGLHDWIMALRLTVAETPNLLKMAETGQPLVIPDTHADPGWVILPESRWLRCHLGAPILSGGQLIGYLNLDSGTPHSFTPGQAGRLMAFADQAAVAIQNARLHEAVRERGRRLELMWRIRRECANLVDLDELLPKTLGLIRDAFGYHTTQISMLEGDEVVLTATSNPALAPRVGKLRLPLGGGGINTWVVEHGEPLLVPDVSREPRYVLLEELEDIRSELAVPIHVQDRVLGALDVQSVELNAFSEIDLFTLQVVAGQIAIGVETARMFEQAQELAALRERQRLARELHDAVSQSVWSAALIAEVLPQVWARDPDEGLRRLESLGRLTRGALAEMRTLLLELRPAALEEAELDALLRQLAVTISNRTGVPVEMTKTGGNSLQPEVKVALYRIAQEALHNIARHAEAGQVRVSLDSEPGRVELSIQDNGRGFDLRRVGPGHLGLDIIRERADAIGASLEIRSRVGRGTRVRVKWPGVV